MTIVEALKQENIRVSTGSKWLVYEPTYNRWEVYEQIPGKSKGKLICSELLESEAVKVLLS